MTGNKVLKVSSISYQKPLRQLAILRLRAHFLLGSSGSLSARNNIRRNNNRLLNIDNTKHMTGCRDQLTGESLAAYSHALMELLERIAKADPSEVPEDGELLLKKFCAGVTDPNLRWELKQQLKAQPQSTFVELRETALRWAEECAPREEPRQVKSAAAVATDQTLNVMLAMKDDIARVSEKLTKQQDTLDLQAAAIDSLQKMLPSGNNEMYGNGQSRVPLMTHGGSNVVCYYCQKRGHIQRDCQKRRRDDAARLGPPQQPGFQQTSLQ